jgi:hypothetical protein
MALFIHTRSVEDASSLRAFSKMVRARSGSAFSNSSLKAAR